MKYAQLVIGPAGCGKSTYCETMQIHHSASGRELKVVNLDPAAEEFRYDCAVDIKELVTVHDVMTEMDLGPNGSLVEAMEYMIANPEWLEERLDGFIDDDYILFDCPGQIELFTHIPVFRQLVDWLQLNDFRIASVFCLDVSFVSDATKYVSGILTALSAMIQLELPHTNILTKCDLLNESALTELDAMLDMSPELLMRDCTRMLPLKYRQLNEAICQLLEDYSLVCFVPLNVDDDDSIASVCRVVDNSIQYGEDLETKANYDIGVGEEDPS